MLASHYLLRWVIWNTFLSLIPVGTGYAIYALFYMFYSGIGLLTFALAIRRIAWVMRQRRLTLWIWAMPFVLLMSLGVYLGLILRLNSWDIISNPHIVWASIVSTLTRPALVSLIGAFAGFLWFVYLVMDIWVDGLVCRFRAGKGASQ